MATRDDALREAFQKLSSKEITDELLEEVVTPLLDFDNQPIKSLFQYHYKMSKIKTVMVVVKKGTEQEKITPQIYKNLTVLSSNQVLVPVRNYYDKGHGMLILGTVDGSLGKWLDERGGAFMFEGTGLERRFSTTFRSLIIDMWSLFDKMSGKMIYPLTITLDDLYVKIMKIDDHPRILILLTQFKELKRDYFYDSEWKHIWTSIEALIEKICEKSGYQLHGSSKGFLKYMQSIHDMHNSLNVINKLKNVTYYPDTWTNDDNSAYLYDIIAGRHLDRALIRKKINIDSKISWPRDANGNILHVIESIRYLPKSLMRTTDGTVRSKYDENYPYDYVQLCRNTHKHFHKLPMWIQKELGGSPQEFIVWMEQQDPDVWTKLYLQFGPLGRHL